MLLWSIAIFICLKISDHKERKAIHTANVMDTDVQSYCLFVKHNFINDKIFKNDIVISLSTSKHYKL